MRQDFCVKEQDAANKREASAEGSLGCVKVGKESKGRAQQPCPSQTVGCIILC